MPQPTTHHHYRMRAAWHAAHGRHSRASADYGKAAELAGSPELKKDYWLLAATHQAPLRYLSAESLRRLMRRHHVTIRELARRVGCTQVRVKMFRKAGIGCRHAARDWIEAITGQDPGRLDGPYPA